MKQKQFVVSWTIDIEADNHKEAAKKALEIMQESISNDFTANVFEVKEYGGEIKTIDLQAEMWDVIENRLTPDHY